MAKLNLMHADADNMHTYRVSFGDLMNSKGESMLYDITYDELGNKTYTKKDPAQYISFGGEEYTYDVDAASGELTWTPEQSATILTFNGSTGEFMSVGADEAGETVELIFNPGAGGGGVPGVRHGQDIFSPLPGGGRDAHHRQELFRGVISDG